MVKKVGQGIVFSGGFKVTVLAWGQQQSCPIAPAAGLRYVWVMVLAETGLGQMPLHTSDFALQDSFGVRRGATACARSDALKSGTILGNDRLAGALVFPAPVGDTRLRVIYSDLFSDPAVFELY
jgi:hypothetical protein